MLLKDITTVRRQVLIPGSRERQQAQQMIQVGA
jgi:hypothetical protein